MIDRRRIGVSVSAIEAVGRHAQCHPKGVFTSENGQDAREPVAILGLLINIAAKHRRDGDLRAIERDAGGHVGCVAEAIDQREHVVGIVTRLIDFAGAEEA